MMNKTTRPLLLAGLALLPGALPAGPNNNSWLQSAARNDRAQGINRAPAQQKQTNARAGNRGLTVAPAPRHRGHLPAVRSARHSFTPHGTAFRSFGSKSRTPAVANPAVAGLKKKTLPPAKRRTPRRPDAVEIPGDDNAAPNPLDRGQPDSAAGEHLDTSSPTDKLGDNVTTGRDFRDARGVIFNNAAHDPASGARLGWTSHDPGVRNPDGGQASQGGNRGTIMIVGQIEVGPMPPDAQVHGEEWQPDSVQYYYVHDSNGERTGTVVVDVSPADENGNVDVRVVFDEKGGNRQLDKVVEDADADTVQRIREGVEGTIQRNPEDDSHTPLLSFFGPDIRQAGNKPGIKDLVGQPGPDQAGGPDESSDIRPNLGLDAVTNPGDSGYAPSTPGSNNGPGIGGTLPDPEPVSSN